MGRSKGEDEEKARRARARHCRRARWPGTKTLRERARERARAHHHAIRARRCCCARWPVEDEDEGVALRWWYGRDTSRRRR